jgi:hypothetical protein
MGNKYQIQKIEDIDSSNENFGYREAVNLDLGSSNENSTSKN